VVSAALYYRSDPLPNTTGIGTNTNTSIGIGSPIKRTEPQRIHTVVGEIVMKQCQAVPFPLLSHMAYLAEGISHVVIYSQKKFLLNKSFHCA